MPRGKTKTKSKTKQSYDVMKPFIAFFDIATVTGCADGFVGDAPRLWSWDARDAGEGRPWRLAHLANWFDAYFRDQHVDQAWCEAPMPVSILARMGERGPAASEDVILYLRGAVGVFEAAAARAGVPLITMVGAQDIRQTFTGKRTFKDRDEGKRAAMAIARMLDWNPVNFDEADAAAGWLHACAQTDPRVAFQISPLMRARAQTLFAAGKLNPELVGR